MKGYFLNNIVYLLVLVLEVEAVKAFRLVKEASILLASDQRIVFLMHELILQKMLKVTLQ